MFDSKAFLAALLALSSATCSRPSERSRNISNVLNAPTTTARLPNMTVPSSTRRASSTVNETSIPPPVDSRWRAAHGSSSEAESAEESPTLTPPKRPVGVGWICFAWIERHRWGQNCYRTSDACQRSRSVWPPNTSPCETHSLPAYCLVVRESQGESTSCFGAIEYCVARQDHARFKGEAFSECVRFR